MVKPNARSPSLTSQESYSTIIIGDLIADVPVAVAPPPEDESQKSKKTQETNLGFDGNMDGEAGTAVEAVTDSNGAGGGGLSKGIILNAVNFGQADSKTKISEKVTEPEKKPEPSFKDMSLPRKILFGFSFLPSILFVLCFAVILPCNVPLKEPCVQHEWITTFNDTEATFPLQLHENALLTLNERGENFLVFLNRTNGAILKKQSIMNMNSPIYLECSNNGTKCAVMDKNRTLYVFDSVEKSITLFSFPDPPSSLPVIMPDCNSDGKEEIAVAVSNTNIRVLTSKRADYIISNCDSVPEKLTAWTTNNSTDLIFFCKNSGKDTLMTVSQEAWCNREETRSDATVIFARDSQSDTTSEYILQTFGNSLLLWIEDEVFLFQNNALKWRLRSSWHSDINRFALGGKFSSGNAEIALFSSDIASNLMVTVLDEDSGNIVTNKTFADYGATEGKLIHGKERDFVLILLQKVKKNLKSEALKQLNDISSTVISLISNEEMNAPLVQFANDTSEEIALMDMIAKFSPHSLKDRDEPFTTSLAAEYDEAKDLLYVYLVTSLKDSNTVEINKLKIANWDISAAKTFECPAS